MSIEIAGKNIDVGEALRSYIDERVDHIIEKYVGSATSGHIRIEKDGGHFKTNCSIHLRSGLDVQAKGESHDVYASADKAFEHLDTRLRRYKRKLKNHHHHASHDEIIPSIPAADYVIQAAQEEEEHDDTPIIVAESQTNIRECAVSDAVMMMDLSEQNALVFKNASHGRLNVVYRRQDGNIGWIDPNQN